MLAILAVTLEVTKSLIRSGSGYAGHAGQTKRAMHRYSSIAIMYGCIILVAYISGTRDSPQTACTYVNICCTEKELIASNNDNMNNKNNIARLSWLVLLKRSGFYLECLFILSV